MHLDTGFRPSKHGFGFPNTWHDVILGVVASRGRCGGMVFAALDRFVAGIPLAGAEVAPALPAHDAPLARLIWRRQVESVIGDLGSNLWRFAALTYLPSRAPGGTIETTARELPRLVAALEAGRPAPLGLVSGLSVRHLARNHQVLAYAVETASGVTSVRIYDPNFPRRDDVVLEVAPGAPVLERVGSRTIPWRGLFVERYRPEAAPAKRSAARAVPGEAGVGSDWSTTEVAGAPRGLVVAATALLGAILGVVAWRRRRR